MVDRNTDIRGRTISSAGVREKMDPTPMRDYANLLLAFSEEYNIDPNWSLAYIQWESAFLRPDTIAAHCNNPYDLLCHAGHECYAPGNGYSYAYYPTVEVGIEDGLSNFKTYVDRGWVTWFSSLSVALCGVPGGCASDWVDKVIATGNENAAKWPYDPGSDCNDCSCMACDGEEPSSYLLAGLVGLTMLGAGVYFYAKAGGRLQ